MKIYKQLNNNDCGISVTQSLINHFYSVDVSREELYANSNISEEGMSILDLEVLNRKYGIILESFEIDYEELKNHQTKDYFILLLKINNLFHYVIAQKKRKNFIIFDSIKGKVTLSDEELREYFSNIFITISFTGKEDLINNYINKNQSLVNLDKIIKHCLINISVLLLTLISSYCNKWIFESLFDVREVHVWAEIAFMFISSYFLISFGEYIQNLMNLKDKHYYQKSLFYSLLRALEKKKNSFFKKIGKHQFLLLREHIENISLYYSEHLNQWIISVITLFLLLNFLLYSIVYFLPVIVFSGVFQYFYISLRNKENKKYLPKILELQSLNKKLNFELTQFVQEEENWEKLLLINNLVKNTFSKYLSSNKALFIKNLFLEKSNLFFENLIFFALCLCGAIFYFNKSISFSNLIMFSSIYGLINKSCNKLINFYFFKTYFLYSQKIYQQFMKVDEILDSEDNNWRLPRKIVIKNLSFFAGGKKIFEDFNLVLKNGTFLYGSSGSGKSTLYRLIVQKISPASGSIFFDKNDIQDLNQRNFKKNLIYQVSNSWIENLDLQKILALFDKNVQTQLLNIFEKLGIIVSDKIDFSKLSSGQKQFLNFLNLFNYSKKVLLLDEILSHINFEVKEIIVKNLIPILMKNNFLICSEHDMKLKKFFPHSICLKNYD